MSFFLIINILYALFNLVLIMTWLKMRREKQEETSQRNTKLTVIIPVRNEEDNIVKLLQDLDSQNYPFENFEVIIANDGSTDQTESFVLAFQENAKFNLKLLNILDDKSSSPKKRAIKKSIEISSGELIITTDGDCRVFPNWLVSIEQIFKTTNAKLVSSPVSFINEHKFWNTAQIIEFASLIGSGACAMYLKKPNMCNGANIAYTREVFEEVGGFAGNEHLASGDDEFLMHKIAEKYPEKVVFNADKNAIVLTNTQADWQHFYQQRRRWASKWKYYKDWKVSALAIFIFVVNLGVIWSFITLNYTNLFLKLVFEFAFLSLIIRFLGHKDKIKYILIVQILYPFYVVFFGLIAQGKGYTWKGRKLS
ncbi:cellulose synthase/poly-beta-1,6-N-acetylglucosamine synthase-like glycosyltransferase [Arcicella aurantiaca]|uniref:Cellulose synthase/poly-beta-1,6-N-acetylglucosamine synthase-like glycosyltransferase n=1 Tax=Arcicella aurantiaca TaxID=591202 RepID=A0A316EAM2_9BACT|nr:glycosyltransferase [Arcicella aurantiaca]PWK26612.1 cellulose synthase/poly-beta-1,6-N-acetylglucosamine synthase-like glycosyltransferase [Arcicella aurantiaca]